MFPTDGEFTGVYVIYVLMLVFIINGLFHHPKSSYYKWNLLAFFSYFLLMVFVFMDPENFKQGNSLAVLFYSAAFVLTHFAILGILKIYKEVKK